MKKSQLIILILIKVTTYTFCFQGVLFGYGATEVGVATMGISVKSLGTVLPNYRIKVAIYAKTIIATGQWLISRWKYRSLTTTEFKHLDINHFSVRKKNLGSAAVELSSRKSIMVALGHPPNTKHYGSKIGGLLE